MSDLVGVIAREVASYKDTEAVEFFEPAGDWRALVERVEKLERALGRICDYDMPPGDDGGESFTSVQYIAAEALGDKAS